jgi:hypothetical protein
MEFLLAVVFLSIACALVGLAIGCVLLFLPEEATSEGRTRC